MKMLTWCSRGPAARWRGGLRMSRMTQLELGKYLKEAQRAVGLTDVFHVIELESCQLIPCKLHLVLKGKHYNIGRIQCIRFKM